eukprot:124422-Rhodomonas_salina.1
MASAARPRSQEGLASLARNQPEGEIKDHRRIVHRVQPRASFVVRTWNRLAPINARADKRKRHSSETGHDLSPISTPSPFGSTTATGSGSARSSRPLT